MAERAKAAEPDPERPRLSRGTVVEQGLELADSGGLDALTIRKLAQHLGVTPMALYWHFRSKDELLEAMASQLWSEIDTEVDPAAPWWEQLRGMLESLIGVLRAHRSGPWLMLENEKQNEPAQRAAEVALGILRDGAGLDRAIAAAIARSALWTGITLVMSEPGSHPGLTEPARAEKQRQDKVQVAMLPPGAYPHLVDCAEDMIDGDPALHYRLGVDMFIAGVRAAAADAGAAGSAGDTG